MRIVRNLALCTITLATVYFVFQSFHHSGQETQQSTRRVLQQFIPATTGHSEPARITKVSTLFVEHENYLYNASLRSHDEHNRLHGYNLKVLRDEIADIYRSTASYLLTLIVNELSKPLEERTEWLVWFAPDVVILNPQIPLETFLPPEDFEDVRFLATHGPSGTFNSGVFFLQVHAWSAKLLTEVLAFPKDDPNIAQARNKPEAAYHQVINREEFRKHTTYQPRLWYNRLHLDANSFNHTLVEDGNLLFHFDEPGGDKWSAMASALEQLAHEPEKWSVPLWETTYTEDVDRYWERLRVVRQLLGEAEPERGDEDVEKAVRRAQYASTYEADRINVINDAIEMLKQALA